MGIWVWMRFVHSRRFSYIVFSYRRLFGCFFSFAYFLSRIPFLVLVMFCSCVQFFRANHIYIYIYIWVKFYFHFFFYLKKNCRTLVSPFFFKGYFYSSQYCLVHFFYVRNISFYDLTAVTYLKEYTYGM